MEAYNDQQQLSENSAPRGNFLYASPILYGRAASSSGNHNHENNQMGVNSSNMFHHLQTDEDHHQHHQIFQSSPVIKSETPNSSYKFQNHYPLNMRAFSNQQQENESSSEDNNVDAIKAKIVSHPQYMNLLEAYMDCQKVGAPPEVVARLAAARQDLENRHRSSDASKDVSKDPELDQFMEAYSDMLVKYREELSRPLQEAMDFMRRIESQLNMLGAGSIRIFNSDEKCDGAGSSEEDQENSGGETEIPEIDPRAEDRELKAHLMRKYSGYLSSLKQELSKKKKKGKLPKEARQKLLSWWELHYKWPYPSETEKVALAEATGLDQKQINNWFINQRKRHWKPSEDMQFMVMDGIHPQSGALYMDGHYMGDGPYRLGP